MAYTKLPGAVKLWDWGRLHQNLTLATSAVIDATGEKTAVIGQVDWLDADTSKTITGVGFRFGAVTKAGGSGLTLSLQNVSLTAGPAAQPDETQDQTFAIANGNASFASNTWINCTPLSANRTVNRGDLIAVVLEYDGGGRLGADSVVMSGLSGAEVGVSPLTAVSLKTGGAWAATPLQIVPNVVFAFSDGTFGGLAAGFPLSAVSSLAYKSDSTPDEYALVWQWPVAGKVSGGWVMIYQDAATSDCEVVLYDSDGTTELATATIDANMGIAASFRFMEFRFATEIAFAANTAYYLSVRPNQATSNMRIAYIDVNAAGHLAAHNGGTNWYIASRTNAGAWNTTTTRRPLIAPVISSIDTGSAGGPHIIRRKFFLFPRNIRRVQRPVLANVNQSVVVARRRRVL